MKDKFTLLLMIIILVFLFVSPAGAEQPTKVAINGELLDAPCASINGRTFLPLRAIFETFGANLSWDSDTKTIVATRHETTISLQIDKTSAYKNGKLVTLDVAPTIINNKTMVPVRFVAESFGCTVGWDIATRTVTLKADIQTKENENLVKKANSGQAYEPKILRSYQIDKDTDGDGLTDYQEINKYFTDPTNKDTDNDGIPDGDWNERREFTYSIRTIVQVLSPWNVKYMSDDHQDIRVIDEGEDILTCEIISYPYNTVKENITANNNWQEDYKDMTEYLKPGITANWDQGMKNDLIAELKRNSIDIDKLSDKEVVEKVSNWLNSNFHSDLHINTPILYLLTYPNGEITLQPKYNEAYEHYTLSYILEYVPVQEVIDKTVLGKSMFYNKTRGKCGSASILWATVFRTLGIPTRIIDTTIVLDGSDPNQLQMAEGLKNERMREHIAKEVPKGAALGHTYNEVFIGNRWVRLNYNELGSDNFHERTGIEGLYVRINTFCNYEDVNFADTFGDRMAGIDEVKGWRYQFKRYKLLQMSDMYGEHMKHVKL